MATSALAALAAAGSDPDSLASAIAGAVFLDAQPGDARQQLRAARSRLRKILADEAARVAAEAARPAGERSPFVKETYDPAEFESLAAAYEGLAWRAVSKPGGATVKPDEFYALLHQQATLGDVTGDRPMWAERGGLDFDGRARWDAWATKRGGRPDRARAEFVRAFWEVSPKAFYNDGRGAYVGKAAAK